MKNRKENRLKKKRYFNLGYYYITLRTYHKQYLFGEIINGIMFNNSVGDMIEEVIKEIPKYYNGFDVDEFIIMPNHIHFIIEIVSDGELKRSGKPWEVSPTD
ncbi:MAG: transposase, partial [Candidatus Delongbacteria bacterium]|nr:transposase [Candidatus Delongbacteria bacterium]